jgi:hypothetical protein
MPCASCYNRVCILVAGMHPMCCAAFHPCRPPSRQLHFASTPTLRGEGRPQHAPELGASVTFGRFKCVRRPRARGLEPPSRRPRRGNNVRSKVESCFWPSREDFPQPPGRAHGWATDATRGEANEARGGALAPLGSSSHRRTRRREATGAGAAYLEGRGCGGRGGPAAEQVCAMRQCNGILRHAARGTRRAARGAHARSEALLPSSPSAAARGSSGARRTSRYGSRPRALRSWGQPRAAKAVPVVRR